MEAQLRRQKGPVTDILQWVQCLQHWWARCHNPTQVLELMAYMGTIVRCNRDYEGPAWVLYDRAFRRRAEATKDLNWSVINTSLFNLCFGGRARRRAICQLCLSKHHTAERCPRQVVALGNTLTYTAAIHSEGIPPHSQSAPLIARPNQSPFEICRLYNARNGSRCRFPQCKYAHICSRCRGSGHGAAQCTGKPPEHQAARRPRPY